MVLRNSEELHKYEFRAAVRRGSKIDAIKVYREWKGVGVKEAANHVQTNWETLRLLSVGDTNG